jgi:hypothetical protein
MKNKIMDDLTRGTAVSHLKLGNGKITEFYEFYNTIFVDVLFEKSTEPIYIKIEDLKIENKK